MDKEEYIFLNKKYENAVTAIKAQLFDVISNEEKKAMRIGLEMSREGISEESYKKLQELAMKQGEDLGRVITLASKLSETLVRLDSYTKILRDLRKEKASTEEVERNVQATAAEVIVSINETDVSQQTKDKVIENVGAIAEATQVEVPEVAIAQSQVATTEQPVVEEVKTEEAVVAPVVEETKTEEAVASPVVEETKTEEAVAAPVIEEAKTEEVAAAPVVEETKTEEVVAAPVVEEAKTEEAVAAPVVEEAKTEEAVATPVVEETKTEEAVAAPVVEEVKTEEKVAEVPAVQEAPVADVSAPLIPVVEETKTEEAVAEVPVVQEAPVADVSAPLIPVVEEAKTEEAVAEVPAVQEAPVSDASAPLIPVVEEAKTEEAVAEVPAVQETPVADVSAPLIPVVEETKTEEEVSAVQEAPVADVSAPLIPVVEETKTEEAVAEVPAVQEAPVADVSAPLIPVVEEAKTEEAVAEVPAVQEAPVADVSAPLIPVVEEAKTEEKVAEVPAVQEAPVADVSAPLIPVVTENVGTEVVDATLTKESTAPVDTNDVVPLIPLPEEVAMPVETTQATPSDEVKVNTPEVATEVVTPHKLTFTKNDNLNARALLTSTKQIGNLRKSLPTQETLYETRISGKSDTTLESQLIANGLLPADVNSMKKQVEQLMEQANVLYKEGKTTEAQAMYDKISELNKQIQEKSSISLSV